MEYFDLDTEISIFPSQASTGLAETITVRKALDDILSGVYKDSVLEYRKTGNSSIKEIELNSVAFHGLFEGSRHKKNFAKTNGIIIVDIDDVGVDNIEDVKEKIVDDNVSVLSVFVSPSGNSLKCLYLVDSLSVTTENYAKINKVLAGKFSKYGKTDNLSVTDCVIMSYDPNIIVCEDAIPDQFIKVEKFDKKRESVDVEKRDETKELYDDAEEFFTRVLVDKILEHATNNYRFIQISVFELAKFGFKAPNHDLSFLVDYAEEFFKKSSENAKRLSESCEKAKDIDQTRWPYCYEKKDDNDMSHESFDSKSDLDEKDRELIEKYVKSVDSLNYEFKDIVNQGKRAGLECRKSNLNDVFRPTPSTVTLVTGISGHGKSEMTLEILLEYCIINDVKAVIFGSEETNGVTLKKLVQKFLGFSLDKGDDSRAEVIEAVNTMNYYFKFIDHCKTDEIEDILNTATALKKMDDKFFFLYTDPYNQISTSSIKEHDQNQTDKKVMSKLTRFVNKSGYHFLLIAHPRKSDSHYDIMPTANSPSGSGDLRNKTHNMLVVHWHKKDDEKDWKGANNIVEVKALKIKQANWGKAWLSAYFKYSLSSTRYIESDILGETLNASPNANKSWLGKIEQGKKNTI